MLYVLETKVSLEKTLYIHNHLLTNISKPVTFVPLNICQGMHSHSSVCVHLSVWINGDWRAAESGWCGVINQRNECRWALCRWSPHSGPCHPAGGLFASLPRLYIVLTMVLTAFLWHVPPPFFRKLLSLWFTFITTLFFYENLCAQLAEFLCKYKLPLLALLLSPAKKHHNAVFCFRRQTSHQAP